MADAGLTIYTLNFLYIVSSQSFIVIRMFRIPVLLCGLSLCSACYSSGVVFDPDKSHHGDGKFISAKEGSFFDWLAMRWREDSPSEIKPEEVKTIVGEVDMELIASPAVVPRATWIGQATVLVQYQGINFLTDPHLSQYPGTLTRV